MSARYHETCHHRIYRLSCAEFDEMWAHAEGRCQICGISEDEVPRGRLSIDHAGEYSFAAVRGLLCDKCNSLMRKVDDEREHRYVPAEQWSQIFHYRYGAWFIRQLDRRGPLRRDRVAGYGFIYDHELGDEQQSA